MLRDYHAKIRVGIVVLVLVATLITIIHGNNTANLPEYHGTESQTEVSSAPEVVPPDTSVYEKDNFKIEIPFGWEKVTKDGFDTFLHTPSQAAIQLRIMDYDPTVNIFDMDQMGQKLYEEGKTLVGFEITSSSGYLLVYTKSDYAYLENWSWDRETVYDISASVPVENYDRMESDLLYCIKTFEHTATAPIPETHFLMYSRLGEYEFGMPITYNYSNSGLACAGTNPETNSVFTVSAEESTVDVGQISEVKYVQLVSPNYNDYLLRSFNNQDSTIRSVATYTLNGQSCFVAQMAVSNGHYQYTLTMTGTTEAYNTDMPLFETACALFRSFDAPAEEPEESEPPESESAEGLPDDEPVPDFYTDEDGNVYYYREAD